MDVEISTVVVSYGKRDAGMDEALDPGECGKREGKMIKQKRPESFGIPAFFISWTPLGASSRASCGGASCGACDAGSNDDAVCNTWCGDCSDDVASNVSCDESVCESCAWPGLPALPGWPAQKRPQERSHRRQRTPARQPGKERRGLQQDNRQWMPVFSLRLLDNVVE